VHELKLAPSSEHSSVSGVEPPASLPLNEKVTALVATRPDGPDPIVVVGPVVSTAKFRVASAPRFPRLSRARTRKVCEPSASAEKFLGLVHELKLAPSSEHSNEATPDPARSSAVNAKLAERVDTVPEGPEAMVAAGPVESIVKLRETTTPRFPTLSRARTRKVCEPSARAEKFFGLVHELKLAPSSEHSNTSGVEPPASLPLNEKVALVLEVEPVGPALMVVVGPRVST